MLQHFKNSQKYEVVIFACMFL